MPDDAWLVTRSQPPVGFHCPFKEKSTDSRGGASAAAISRDRWEQEKK